jgi:uncharacterized protein
MRVWYDACTGKHIRYGAALGKALKNLGHEFIFTTRRHPDTLPLARILGEKPLVIGEYNPTTLFANMFEKTTPEVAIAHQSVELCRTAFGLNIPIILTADTPHAESVNRLTIPFANTVVVSEAMPKSFTQKYCAQKTIYFKGVDEVAWIQGFKHPKTSAKKPLIVLRQVETQAAYAKNQKDTTKTLAEQLMHLGDVHLLQRYCEENQKFGEKPFFEDSASLVATADLVVSYGGTISREAALMGVPSIAIGDMAYTPVNTYLAKKGFPLFITSQNKVVDLAKKHLTHLFDVKDKLAALENPVDPITKILESLSSKSQ